MKPIIPQKGDVYPLRDAKITVISSEIGSTSNNSSLVLKAEYGNTSFLFTGDAEEPLERNILNSGADIKCDVLKVAHHGSDTSTSDAFLAAAAPKVAVISCGWDNAYGYPSEKVLNKLSEISVWRTDEYGNIAVISNGHTYEIIANNPVPLKLERSVTYPEQSCREWYADMWFAYDRPLPWENLEESTTPAKQTPAPTPEPVPKPAPTPEPEPNYSSEPIPHFHPTEPEERKIYITRTVKRYHYDPHCNGATYYESTLEEALSRELTPCNKRVLK